MSSVLKCTTNQHILMCIPTFQIEDRKVGDVDIVNDLNLLMDLPLDSLETHFESEESFLPITRFLANYVSKLYGKNHIRDKLKNNKGMSFLDILTMSDVAYVVTVLWNNLDYWLQLIELDALPQIERDKYLVKNRHKLPKNEWEKYTKKQTRFTSATCVMVGRRKVLPSTKRNGKCGGDSLQIEMCGRSWKLHERAIYQDRSGDIPTLIILAVWRRWR